MPLGGMVQTDQNIGSVDLKDTQRKAEVFTPAAASTLYVAGTLLGRITATGKLLPSLAAAGDGSEVPVGVLSEDITSTSGPADENIRMIVWGGVRESRLQRLPAARGTITKIEADQLRNVGIYMGDDTQLLKFDNS